MTNYDLEYFYELLTHVRFDTKRKANILCLQELINAIDNSTDGPVMTNDVKERIANCMRLKYYLLDYNAFAFINSSDQEQEISIDDKNVVVFFRKLFLEIKYLCETERFESAFYLIDYTHNMPEAIYENNYKLPVKQLKSCLKSYLRKYKKYKKEFLRDFIGSK